MLSPLATLAHDFWIEPSSFRPQPGQAVSLRLRVGEHFLGDPLPRDPTLLERFVAIGPSGEEPILGRPGQDPAGMLPAGSDGLHIVVLRSRPSRVELPAADFEKYLAQEGLEQVSAVRARRGESDKGVREIFSRCAKSLILVGGTRPSGRDRAVGLTLELVLARNPYELRTGDELPVRLLYQSKPLRGALVVAMNRKSPAQKLTARSGRDGRVRFRLDRPGDWLIKAVHMVPAATDSNADWESLWASVTFQIQGSES
jgi:uncharacterized GH25 family protein